MYNSNQFNQLNGVNPMSQQAMMAQRLGMGNFQQSFATPQTLIERPDFVNRGNVIHNNLGTNLLSEHVMEYQIHVDSADRSTSTYPSPFKMKVMFGNTNIQESGGTRVALAPSISRKFKNIKYITLESIVLPRTVAIDVTKIISGSNLYPTASAFVNPVADVASSVLNTLTNHKYIIVRIDELHSEKNLGTSNLLDRDTFAFVPDTQMGLDCWLWKPMHNNRVIYHNASLCNLSSLTLTVLDENGNVLKLVDQAGLNIIGTNMTSVNKDYNKYVADNISVPSVAYTNTITQVVYNFTFGVIENEINTMTNY